MKKKRAYLSEEDRKFARESELSVTTIANILQCSVSLVCYYRNHNSIWRKRK